MPPARCVDQTKSIIAVRWELNRVWGRGLQEGLTYTNKTNIHCIIVCNRFSI